MQIRQQNKYRSYLSLQATCQRYGEVFLGESSPVPEFAASFAAFGERLTTIGELAQRQAEPTTGFAVQKRHAREQMCDAAATIAAAVSSWALKTEQFEIAQKADWSYSALLAGRDTFSADRCRNIHKLATEHLESLGDFGVTAKKLKELKDKIDAYAACIAKPREAITSTKTVTEQLAAEFEAADKLLTEGLDKLILQFKTTAPEFYTDYQNARVVVEQAGTRETGEPTSPAPTPLPPVPKAA